jgi:hypothetical protein
VRTYTGTLSVANAAPTASILSPSSGVTYKSTQTIVVYVTFADVGKNDTHTCSANWSDGTSSAGTVSESPGSGSGTCTLSHAYANASPTGGYLITVTVTDNGGASVTKTVTVYVSGAKGNGPPKPFAYHGNPDAPAVVRATTKSVRGHHPTRHRGKAKAKGKPHRAKAAKGDGWRLVTTRRGR